MKRKTLTALTLVVSLSLFTALSTMPAMASGHAPQDGGPVTSPASDYSKITVALTLIPTVDHQVSRFKQRRRINILPEINEQSEERQEKTLEKGQK